MASAQKKQSAQGLPDNVIGLLSAADTRNGLPPGTMFSIMQQEIGGQYDRFLKDPAAYHYEADAQGRRIAKHTGKISTAFGPMGILESTAKDPGYGVTPLKDKSIEEQIRFSSDYTAARTKHAGSLQGGLAGYGEGKKYAAQVAARLPGQVPAAVTQVQVAQAAPAGPQPLADGAAQLPIQEQAPSPDPVVAAAPAQTQAPAQLGPDPWQLFLEAGRQPQPMQVSDLEFGGRRPAGITVPDFSAAVAGAGQGVDPNFNMLTALRGFA